MSGKLLRTLARCRGAAASAAAIVAAAALLTSCDSMHESRDFARHSLSQLSAPLEGGDFYWFDVKLTADMPDDNELAEAQRLEWLATWLQSRSLCMNGYQVMERRPFEFLEHNPARYDLRYKVQCSAAASSAAG